MKISSMSDSEILEIAEPVRQDVIDGSNRKDWALHARNLPAHVIENDDIKKNVEKQWREDEAALSPRTSLRRESEYLGVIRKKEVISVLWKQKSTLSDEEYLLKIVLKEINSELKQVGAWLD